MAAVLEYINTDGYRKQRAWRTNDDRRFTALAKCYVQLPGEKQKVIEKPSTRPATFNECCLLAKKLKSEYGNNLKQMIIWDMDEISAISY